MGRPPPHTHIKGNLFFVSRYEAASPSKRVKFSNTSPTFDLDSSPNYLTENIVISDEDEDNIVISSDEENKPSNKTRTSETLHFKQMKERACKEEYNYNFEMIGEYTYRLLKKTGIQHPIHKVTQDGTYIVTFNPNEVTCTCPHYKEIIAGKVATARSRREICKHIAMIVLKSPPAWHSFYKVQ